MAGASCSDNIHHPEERHPQRHPQERFREDSGGRNVTFPIPDVTLSMDAGLSEHSSNFFQIKI
jgi:hypothetical protein